ncbi:MAG: glycosyltransferase [Parachlamydia sp.]|jgi:glycosyltransferase involved in cell wall biosynthesis|nr:glycosyltransferase [Parachlamydia sp.]
MPDLFDDFISHYEKGERLKAFQLLFPVPGVSLDSLASSERAFPYFVNFADASIHKGALEYKQTFLVLESLCQEYGSLKYIADAFLEAIRLEFILFTGMHQIDQAEELPLPLKTFFEEYQRGILGREQQIDQALVQLPAACQSLLRPKLVIAKGVECLIKEKPALMEALGGSRLSSKIPFHPFSYPPESMNAAAMPFLEPVENYDYSSLKGAGQPLFVFPTVTSFLQLLQFPVLHEIFADSRFFVYILELYPKDQMESQKGWHVENLVNTPFNEALQACLKDQSPENFNWLYQVSKRLLREHEVHRYGKERAIAHGTEQGLQEWYDPYKGLPPKEAPLGPQPHDYMKDLINEALAKRYPRPFAPKNKIRLAHIVPQIVDGGHAPTRLLKTLCTFADRQWFDICVISTERLTDHLMSYPIASYVSPSSNLRGALTMQYLKDLGIHVSIDPKSPTYEIAIKETTRLLSQYAIDIAVFHGPDEMNSMIASQTDAPLRLLFDHGTLPPFPCFDLAIISTDEAYNQTRERYLQQGMESALLHFSLDVRLDWQKAPFSKEALGLPVDSFVMTTISNHLDTRLTPEMCRAIAAILKKCPKAVYAPIGEMAQKESRMLIFKEAGVESRVFFLGQLPTPGQFARSMDLYLNEFPFGSGLSLLEAMAAGCPIVSMYDETGPQQSRYGANYFGKEYMIASGKVDDYVNLACRLYENKNIYMEWSQHALTQYEKRADLDAYVRHFENIIDQFVHYKFPSL